MTTPLSCKPGYYCPGGLAQRCPPGTYNNRSGISLRNSCVDCTPGMFCPGYGNINPQGYCKEGFYCQGGASSITPNGSHPLYPLNGLCPAGRYCPMGTPSPIKCPRGKFGNKTGARTDIECYPCTPGSYCDVAGITAPTGPCAEGWYCPDGHLNTVSTPQNFTCWVGHFCPPGTALPMECEGGTHLYFSIHCFV